MLIHKLLLENNLQTPLIWVWGQKGAAKLIIIVIMNLIPPVGKSKSPDVTFGKPLLFALILMQFNYALRAMANMYFIPPGG